MAADDEFEIFLVTPPGLETALGAEARATGFAKATAVKGGVAFRGGWSDVYRANLELRGASRVLARVGAFRALHLAQLDKRARRIPWRDLLRAEVPIKVEASCSQSRIYHSGAAAQRISRAIKETAGAVLSAEAQVTVKARIEDDLCTLAIDTSGELLHKRGFKLEVNKAPMRETLAALFLRQCGFEGREPVVDPMCGSGTFVIEAAEIAAGLNPGRGRHFAFEMLANFDKSAWARMREASTSVVPAARFYGFDRDPGAIRMSRANAERAGVGAFTEFRDQPIEDLQPPDGPPGLVAVNPPYGERIGENSDLQALYRTLGQSLRTRFKGWRVGLITTDAELARATGITFKKPGPAVSHGGIRVTLYRSDPLA